MSIAIYAAVAAFAGALIAIAVYHSFVVRRALAQAQALLGVHDDLIGGGASAADRLDRLQAELASMRASLHGYDGRIRHVEALARTDVSRIGFVRYDAFDDMGSELSYAIALLNREGDGVVVSSIYSRTDTRTFAKGVQGYKPSVNASNEELLAIERARSAPG